MENFEMLIRRSPYKLGKYTTFWRNKNIYIYKLIIFLFFYHSKKGYPAEPDREKFTDSKGKRIRCYNCKLPPKHLKPVMSCDFCCLTPPLTIAPPLHKRWMCPLHADHALVSKKKNIYIYIVFNNLI